MARSSACSGPNGAGKTTTINMILGVLAPTSGQHRGSRAWTSRSQRRAALARTNFAAVYATLPGNLTVQENLRVFGLIYGVRELRAAHRELLEQFDLERFRDTRCGVLSSGEQTRVSLAKALLNRRSLLLLDEPTASLDPSTAQIVRARIREMAGAGRCGILWTSHNMYEVEEVCDRVLFLSHGQHPAGGRSARPCRGSTARRRSRTCSSASRASALSEPGGG